jgi:hypothetical protein
VKRNKVFISYTLQDSIVDRDLLSKVYANITSQLDTFIDLINNDSADKQNRVMSELRTSQYLCVLESPSIRQSIWVKKEIEEAHNLNIPIYYVPLDTKNGDNAKKIVLFIKQHIMEDKNDSR